MPSQFTHRYADPAGSPIRELFPYLAVPGMISLAGGYPSPDLFDAEGLRAAASLAMESPEKCLQYGATEGDADLRAALAGLMKSRGIHCQSGETLVTTGSQQAFDLLVRILIEPGDVVCVESPTYPATLQALNLAGASIQAIDGDADGLRTDLLEQWLRTAHEAKRLKLLYVVPAFSNPTGATLSEPRRRHLIELAIAHRFIVVEDDPYGEIAFTARRATPLFELGRQSAGKDNPVIYLSSLSKTVAPALRIGWMVANPDVLRRCAVAKQTADLCTSPLAQRTAAMYLASGRYAPRLEIIRAEYGKRMQAMSRALEMLLPGCVEFAAPEGGMFFWVACAIGIDPGRLFSAAVKNRVLFVPGRAFFADKRTTPTLRLSFAASSADLIQEGVARLGAALRAAA